MTLDLFVHNHKDSRTILENSMLNLLDILFDRLSVTCDKQFNDLFGLVRCRMEKSETKSDTWATNYT